MKKTNSYFLIGVILFVLFSSSFHFIDLSMVFSTSQIENIELDNNSQFQELLPGIFVNYSWSNSSESYTELWVNSYENITANFGTIEPGDDHDPSNDILWDPYIIEVFDSEGKAYFIHIEEQREWSGSKNSTEFIVEIFLDADHSSINNFTRSETSLDLAHPSYTGDEVYYSTNFYMFNWSYSYFTQSNYSWYNSLNVQVNPNGIVLADDYKWASYYKENYVYKDAGHYSMFGFSVLQQTLLNITTESYPTFEIEHFFQGFSVFNDSNSNGIIDVSYDEYYALGEEAEIALSSDPTNNYKAGNSELVYEVWLKDISLDEIVVPHVLDNQIDWSIKLKNVYAELWTGDGLFSNPTVSIDDGLIKNEAAVIEVQIPEIVFKNHFLVENNVAKLKVDTIIGDFQNPTTGLIPKEFEGLSLAINYWSSVISINDMSYDLHLRDRESEEEILITEPVYNSSEWKDDLAFEVSSEVDDFKHIPVAVEFEDMYTWTKDQKEYKVKTALVPTWIFGGDIYHQAGNTDDYGFTAKDVIVGGTYYYSSCYIQWDGYGIIHDPIYSSIIPEWSGIITLIFPLALLAGILVVMVLVVGNLGVILIRSRKI